MSIRSPGPVGGDVGAARRARHVALFVSRLVGLTIARQRLGLEEEFLAPTVTATTAALTQARIDCGSC